MKLARKIIFFAAVVSAASAFAQGFPMPAAATAPPAICTGCTPAENEGLPTAAYDAPILGHTGRYLDAYKTISVQNAGMRTIRARTVRVSPATNRIYVQIGEAIASYPLDTFFSGRLKEPMIRVNQISTGWHYGGRNPYEQLASPDSFFYAEGKWSGWQTSLIDSQKNLNEFDADDRGYVYVATTYFGWGIARDTGITNREHMDFVHQAAHLVPDTIFTIRDGGKYYAVASVQSSSTTVTTMWLIDVTAPNQPVYGASRNGKPNSVARWAKSDAHQRVAYVATDGQVYVYSYSGLVAGAAPLATLSTGTTARFNTVTIDAAGNIWAAGAAGVQLRKLTPNGAGYTAETFTGIDDMNVDQLDVAAGYLVAGGRVGTGPVTVRLFRVDGFVPAFIDTGDFFRRYYFSPDPGYASAGRYLYMVLRGLKLVHQGVNTYLMISANGLGDVYEIPTIVPSIGNVTPNSGPPAGGTTVTIPVVQPPPNIGVTVDGIPVNATVTDTAITFTTPAHAPGVVNVVVSTPTAALSTQQYTYIVKAPASFTATGTSGSTVALSWSAVESATRYVVQRRVNGNWTVIADTPGLTFTDTGLAANSAYVYRLHAADASGYTSGFVSDFATTRQFASAAAIAPGMIVRGAHLDELRVAANAMRAAIGLAPYAFTTGPVVKESDIYHLRLAITEARNAIGEPVTFAENVLFRQYVRASHFQELLNAIR